MKADMRLAHIVVQTGRLHVSQDPFGPSFDPDAMLAALRAGTPESELTTRAWAMTCPQRNVPALPLST